MPKTTKKQTKASQTTNKSEESCCADMSSAQSCCNSKKSCCSKSCAKSSACGGCFYFLGFLGAAIFYIGQATTFWGGVWGFIKALVWPAFLVYELLRFIWS